LKIKLENESWLILILTVLLIALIAFFPSNVLRIILGIPLVLFFPGYTLISALFPKKGALEGIFRVALSFGLSVAIVGFISYILNHTPLGVKVYPILIFITLFICVTSVITWYRRHRLPKEMRADVAFNITLSFLNEMHGWNKALAIILIVLIIIGIGISGYIAAVPRVGEQFTEFYALGLGHEVKDYPKELIVGEKGWVIVGITNYEKAEISYWIDVIINGEKNKEVGPIVLNNTQNWEEKVNFIPTRAGENQEVELLLFKDRGSEPYSSLSIRIDVKERE